MIRPIDRRARRQKTRTHPEALFQLDFSLKRVAREWHGRTIKRLYEFEGVLAARRAADSFKNVAITAAEYLLKKGSVRRERNRKETARKKANYIFGNRPLGNRPLSQLVQR